MCLSDYKGQSVGHTDRSGCIVSINLDSLIGGVHALLGIDDGCVITFMVSTMYSPENKEACLTAPTLLTEKTSSPTPAIPLQIWKAGAMVSDPAQRARVRKKSTTLTDYG